MTTEKLVLSKLFTKTELDTHKVELGLIQDLNKEADRVALKTKDIASEGQRIGRELFNFRDTYNVDAAKLINLIADYKKMAKELGIDIDGKYDKILNGLSEAKSTYRDLIS
jgi:hypothetical protein